MVKNLSPRPVAREEAYVDAIKMKQKQHIFVQEICTVI